MCKAFPGPRCKPHTVEGLANAISKRDNFKRDIEALLDGQQNASTRKNIARKQASLTKAEAGVKEWKAKLVETNARLQAREEEKAAEKIAKEQAEAEAQEARVAAAVEEGKALRGRPAGTKEFTENITFSFALSDWEDVEIGFTDSDEEDFSKYVRNAVDNGVKFEAAPASKFIADSSKVTHHADEASRGRLPTKTGENRDIRKDVTFTPEQVAKIEAGAALYRLKRTDYVRRVILGLDMRKSEGHMSKKTYEAREQFFARKEAAAGFTEKSTGSSIQDFYTKEWADTMVSLRGDTDNTATVTEAREADAA